MKKYAFSVFGIIALVSGSYGSNSVFQIDNQSSETIVFAGFTVGAGHTSDVESLVGGKEDIEILKKDGSSLRVGSVVDEDKCTHRDGYQYSCYFKTVFDHKTKHCYLLKTKSSLQPDLNYALRITGVKLEDLDVSLYTHQPQDLGQKPTDLTYIEEISNKELCNIK